MYSRGAVERFCEVDGVRFFTTPGKVAKGKGRWCSKPCWGKSIRTSVKMACIVCGKEKWVAPSHASHGEGNYCSVAHREQGHRDLVLQVRKCLFCAKEFEILPSRLSSGHRGLYCKKTHALAARKGIQRPAGVRAKISAGHLGKKRPERIVPPMPFICAGCGKPDTAVGPKRIRLRKGIRCFCTTECWYKFAREHPEANGQFRGGKDPYYGPNWNEQARLARARDGHTCQDCGVLQPDPLLDVHHLVPRRSFNGDFHAANVLSNLVSLCKSCHKHREAVLHGAYKWTTSTALHAM